ncbi:MAG: hypothetical protein K6L60_05625 [Oceanobacter sp.]
MKLLTLLAVGICMSVSCVSAMASTLDAADVGSVIGVLSAWNTLPLEGQVVAALVLLSHAASWVTALTPTPKDDVYAGKLKRYTSGAYKFVELLALVNGKAKQRQSSTSMIDDIEAELREKSGSIYTDNRITVGFSVLRGVIDSEGLPDKGPIFGNIDRKTPSIPSSELSDGE